MGHIPRQAPRTIAAAMDPHCGLHPSFQKSTCIEKIDFQTISGMILVILLADFRGYDTAVGHRPRQTPRTSAAAMDPHTGLQPSISKVNLSRKNDFQTIFGVILVTLPADFRVWDTDRGRRPGRLQLRRCLPPPSVTTCCIRTCTSDDLLVYVYESKNS